jgi:integrase
MRGTVAYQIQRLFDESGIDRIGESRHDAKHQARSAGGRTPADLAAATGIHSYNTADSYRAVWRQLLECTKENFGIKDVERLEPLHIRTFLELKIEEGVAHATWTQYAAACTKLEVALTSYAAKHETSRQYQFRDAINEVRIEAHAELTRFSGSRAYQNPENLIHQMSNPNFKLTAELQLQGGGRINEVALIKNDQLKGLIHDPVTNDLKGAIRIKGKGGKVNHLLVTPQTYRELESAIQKQGWFHTNKDAYRTALKEAAATSGQVYKGSHGLRWCYARNRYQEVQQHGYTQEQALVIVSKAMSHERGDITRHYLK